MRKRIRINLLTGLMIHLSAGIIFSAPLQAQTADQPGVMALPEPNLGTGVSLMHALKNRRSSRSFSDKELPLDVLSNLLWAAVGINRPGSKMLTAPTAMNAQEIDVYVALEQGLFLYDRLKHQLIPVITEDIRALTGIQDFTQVAPVNLIFVADLDKFSMSDEDEEFYAATDTGYVSQNVYLFCSSEGLATVVLGMIDRPALGKKMQLKPRQRIMLTQPVGFPR